jgi:hypothetical protein
MKFLQGENQRALRPVTSVPKRRGLIVTNVMIRPLGRLPFEFQTPVKSAYSCMGKSLVMEVIRHNVVDAGTHHISVIGCYAVQ